LLTKGIDFGYKSYVISQKKKVENQERKDAKGNQETIMEEIESIPLENQRT
jgi:hypothetical protein